MMGLSPRTAANHTIRRRGATAERSTSTVAFNRRCATTDHKLVAVGTRAATGPDGPEMEEENLLTLGGLN